MTRAKSEKDTEQVAREELRHAREAEAAWQDARLAVQDAAVLRLFALEQELRPYVSAMPEAKGFIDLSLVLSHPPRLWIDLSSYVQMDESGRQYELVQETLDSRKVLFASPRLEDMTAFVRRFIAHRVARRHRYIAEDAPLVVEITSAASEKVPNASVSSPAPVWLAWLAGLISGILLFAAWIALFGIPSWLR